VITKSDKRNCTVVLDREKYDEKLNELLADCQTYTKLTRDPTLAVESKFIFELYKAESISQSQYYNLVAQMQLHLACMVYLKYTNPTRPFNRLSHLLILRCIICQNI